MSAFTETQVLTQNYLIEPNPHYDFKHKATDTYILQNIAEDVNYVEGATTSTNKNQLNFQINPSNFFFDRGVMLDLDIPLVFTRTAAAKSDISLANYVTDYFEDYTTLAWRQFGFLNAVETIAINIDGFNHQVTDVAEMMQIMSRYYNEDLVHQRIPASVPDCMDYPNYAQSSKPVLTYALDGTSKMMVKPSMVNSHNPFGTFGNPDFNTRVPAITFGTCDKTKLYGTIMSEQCFLPFSIFGLAGLDTQPLNGVKSITIKISLKADWARQMFCFMGTTFSDVTLNDAELNTLAVRFRYRTYTAPKYIEEAHKLSMSTIPDNSLRFNQCQLINTIHDQVITDTASIPTLVYKVNAIPKAIYIAATMKGKGVADVFTTPNVFARIDGLSIEVAGKKTILPSHPAPLMQIAKANGLQDSLEVGYYLGGYPLKLNMSDDLAAQTNSLVGSRKNVQSELRIHNLKLTNVARAGKATTYSIKVIVVYDSLLTQRNGKYNLYETLLENDQNISIEAHVSELYNGTIDGANVIGGSFLTKLAPMLGKVVRGSTNLAKKLFTDPAFRAQIQNAWNGSPAAQAAVAAQAATPGGFSSHVPGGYNNVIAGFSPAMEHRGGSSVASLRY